MCDDLNPDHFFRNSCLLTRNENGRLDAVSMVRMVSSLIGLLGSCSIILSAILRRRVCSREIHPIFMLSLADCLLSGLWIAGSSIWLSNLSDRNFDRVYCYPITLLTGMVECVALNLTLVYGLLAYYRTKNTDTHIFLLPSSQRQRGMSFKAVAFLYLIAWTFPVIVMATVFGVTAGITGFLSITQSCSCWCRPTIINILPFAQFKDKESSDYMKRQLYFTVSIGCVLALQYIVVFVLLVILYVKTLSKIASLKKDYESRSEAYNYGATAILARGQSRAAKRVMLFLTVFVFSGFFNLCCAVMLLLLMLKLQNNFEMKKWSDAYNFFLFAQSLTLPLQGFLNAIVYGWTREDFVSTMSFALHNDQQDEAFRENDKERSFTSTTESCTSPRVSKDNK
ncbi:PREDICTED: transmembrane protein 116-like [Amphimedon queenslandica]|uniref:G-protein coupled receptors family 1 profile domain-containing protein n=2 Tax=Amphimedon queenslandica TaxID=400682 RepID=A0AAN0J570_AMPQE|nr:PREDICTED: transmembrane protein 116-like [Amphimedon queenslandica]|eukprot:XP_019852164.1 PREDICTED: transmembrane protein 116-like [Amphimedon queenslandica]